MGEEDVDFFRKSIQERGIHQKTEQLLQRLYIVTTIGHNLFVMNKEDGIQFMDNMSPLITKVQSELLKDIEKYTREHGEV